MARPVIAPTSCAIRVCHARSASASPAPSAAMSRSRAPRSPRRIRTTTGEPPNAASWTDGTWRSNEPAPSPGMPAGAGPSSTSVGRRGRLRLFDPPAREDLRLLAGRQLGLRLAARDLGVGGADPCGVGLHPHALEPRQCRAELRGPRLGQAQGVPGPDVQVVDLREPLAGGRLGVVGPAGQRGRRPELGGATRPCPPRAPAGRPRPVPARRARGACRTRAAPRAAPPRRRAPGRPRSRRPRTARRRARDSRRTGRPRRRPRSPPAWRRPRPKRRTTSTGRPGRPPSGSAWPSWPSGHRGSRSRRPRARSRAARASTAGAAWRRAGHPAPRSGRGRRPRPAASGRGPTPRPGRVGVGTAGRTAATVEAGELAEVDDVRPGGRRRLAQAAGWRGRGPVHRHRDRRRGDRRVVPIERVFGRTWRRRPGERAGGDAAMYEAAGDLEPGGVLGRSGHPRGLSADGSLSQRRAPARHQGVRRDRDPDLAPGRRAGSDRLDDRRTDGRAEDDAEGQEGDLGWAHGPPCLPRASRSRGRACVPA